MSRIITVVHRVCSWCSMQFADETWRLANADEITTWGICPSCLARLQAGSKKRRTKRQPQKRLRRAAPHSR